MAIAWSTLTLDRMKRRSSFDVSCDIAAFVRKLKGWEK